MIAGTKRILAVPPSEDWRRPPGYSWITWLVVVVDDPQASPLDTDCLEETHVDVDKTNRFSIAGFDLLTYSLHAKYGRATYIRDISDAHHVILRIIIKIDATRCQILRLKCIKIFPLPCI